MNVIDRIAIALCVAATLSALPAVAQTFPSKPIRVIVPYPPGGTSDILTRLIGVKLTESWGQQVIADNRSGASGNIGAGLTARAAPDGYTLLLTDVGNLTISSILFTKLPFNVLEDFAPVTTISYSPHLLATHPSVPVKTTKELIALAKAHPGKLNFATALGGAPHLAGLNFAQRTGINWVFVPTKGGSQSSFAVTTGDGDVLFLGILQTLPQVNIGKLKAIANTYTKRMSAAPNLATAAEQGYPVVSIGHWAGLMAPKSTPPEILEKVNAELQAVLKTKETIDRLVPSGIEPAGGSIADFAKFIGAERARLSAIAKKSGMKEE